ncbi:uncharacterized protein DS421_13g396990 [Arachis hypogaea]|nr:uncharacterized protein DS421_13g396990 [Arachis hypogaea]
MREDILSTEKSQSFVIAIVLSFPSFSIACLLHIEKKKRKAAVCSQNSHERSICFRRIS